MLILETLFLKFIHFVALLASFTTKYDNNIITRVSAVTKTTLNLVPWPPRRKGLVTKPK